jgi:transglutaminase superfamily protein
LSSEATLEPPTEAGRSAYRRLSVRQKLLLATEILVAYTRVRWWLRRRGFEETLLALRAGGPPFRSPDGDQLLVGIKLGRIVAKTLRILPTDTRCLVRSLVLVCLLARRGIASRLVIGVLPERRFAAHAWVEFAGYPLLPAGAAVQGRLADL